MARSPSLPLLIHVLSFLLSVHLVIAYTALSDESLRSLPDPWTDFDINSGALLSPILRPRVPGTPGSTYVLNHFIDFFKTSLPKWEISFQNSTYRTPATQDKEVPFVNMIVSRDPPWTTPGEVGRLTLVAHYDSKLTPEGFIGATDSAAPCAMIMHAARSVDAALTKKWAAMQADGVGVGDSFDLEDHQGIQIIFLDGEEAFVSWTDTDSLYGARSLAQEWEATSHPALSTYHTPLSSISLFVLLDLLGSKDPRVPSFFKTTHWAYRKMSNLETRLRSVSRFKSSPNHPSKRASSDIDVDESSGMKRKEPAFLSDFNKDQNRWIGGMVLDDHIPFMARGVNILHIIPTPFPRVWHEMEDDGEHLDLDTVIDWAILVTAFVGEWMDLEGYLGHVDGEHLARPGDRRRTEL
ncbi:hypothetical protein MMC24_005302 [Lignoscripta atroalba]|nr:hypothetical protein [Lignoscripta atroalba]